MLAGSAPRRARSRRSATRASDRSSPALRERRDAVKRSITGFHLDDVRDWVAELDCGHGQHVRHRPPFVLRPWVVSEAGRAGMLGAALDCVRCDRMEWPDGLVAYRRTPEFDETTIPSGLRAEHATKRGAWARVHVLSGALQYHVGAPIHRSLRIDSTSSAVIVPEVPHRVAPEGPVRFFIEFSRAARANGMPETPG